MNVFVQYGLCCFQCCFQNNRREGCYLFGAKMELNGFIDFDKMLYLQGKM